VDGNPSSTAATVLVTGATGALGRAVVRRFLLAGSRVLAVDRDGAALAALEATVPGGTLVGRAADLTDAASTAEAFDWADGVAGTPGAVVHLVGGFRFGHLAELGDEDWRFLLAANVETTFQVLRHSSRRFAVAGGGSFVAVSAPAALAGAAGVGAYAAAKAAVLRLVESAAREMAAFGGRANAVLPGTMDTPANRAASPQADPAGWVSTDDVAEVIHFLASPAARAVNGAAVRVPGPTL
jgi:NAD(P)-dependent dehydrogenase (short-subunit alcohol dehydrogenase family)